jgi:hypothetical protein
MRGHGFGDGVCSVADAFARHDGPRASKALVRSASSGKRRSRIGAAVSTLEFGAVVNLGRNDPCWCASGKKYKNCHLQTNQLGEPLMPKVPAGNHPTAPASPTRPPTPSTGYSHPRCYAGDLSDCSYTITREHYFSRNILSTMGSGRVSGFAWQSGETKELDFASLTSKILCDRHNSALSPLDAEAGELFMALGEIDAALADAAPAAPSKDYSLNGADLERWLLKVLVGICHAKGIAYTKVRCEQSLIRVLVGLSPWPPWWGLHLAPLQPPSGTHYFKGLGVEALSVGDEVWGMRLSMAGLVFQLCLGEPDRDQVAYHPSGIRFSFADRAGTQSVTFTWPGRPYAQYCPLTRQPYQGEPIVHM